MSVEGLAGDLKPARCWGDVAGFFFSGLAMKEDHKPDPDDLFGPESEWEFEDEIDLTPADYEVLLAENDSLPPIQEDERTPEGDMTALFIQRRFDCIPASDAEMWAYRLNKFFGSGLWRKAERRARAPAKQRLRELYKSGISAAEAEVILTKEGYFGNMPLLLSR